MAFDHIFITLVHGTWGWHTPWVQDDSRLCQQLRTRFGDRLHLTRFAWAGWNQGLVRLKAAKRLRVHLQKLIIDHPEAQHFIIAHSHGGNVAMYALQDEALEAKISGLVCAISTRPLRRIAQPTPFLHVYSREASRGGGETLTLGMLNALPLFLIALLVKSGQVKNSAAPLVIGLLAILGCLLFMRWCGFFSWLSVFPIRLVNALPFGLEVAVAAPFIEIFAEATPPGTWKVIQLSRSEYLWPRNDQSETGGLRHSAVYDSQLAILEVAVFLLEGLDAAVREKFGPNLSQLSAENQAKP